MIYEIEYTYKNEDGNHTAHIRAKSEEKAKNKFKKRYSSECKITKVTERQVQIV